MNAFNMHFAKEKEMLIVRAISEYKNDYAHEELLLFCTFFFKFRYLDSAFILSKDETDFCYIT